MRVALGVHDFSVSPMDEKNILRLWPTTLMRKRFASHEAVKPALLAFINSYMETHPHGRRANENRGLYESGYDILRRFADSEPAIKTLKAFLSEAFFEVGMAANSQAWKRAEIATNQASVNITASWFIDYQTQGNVLPHLHGNSSWSCVYYLQMNASNDPMNGATYFICPTNKSDSDDAGAVYCREASRFFTATEGYALFFPSYLIHGSLPYRGDRSRIVFSANARIEAPQQNPEVLPATIAERRRDNPRSDAV